MAKAEIKRRIVEANGYMAIATAQLARLNDKLGKNEVRLSAEEEKNYKLMQQVCDKEREITSYKQRLSRLKKAVSLNS